MEDLMQQQAEQVPEPPRAKIGPVTEE